MPLFAPVSLSSLPQAVTRFGGKRCSPYFTPLFCQLLPSFPLQPGVQAQPVLAGPDATILGFAAEHALQSIHDIAFLNQGSDQGVAIGDEYVVVWNEGTGVPPEVEGRFQVISVHPDHSCARIVWLRNPVFETGGRVALDRKMPRPVPRQGSGFQPHSELHSFRSRQEPARTGGRRSFSGT